MEFYSGFAYWDGLVHNTRTHAHAHSFRFDSNLSGTASTTHRQRDTVGTRNHTAGGKTSTIKGSEKHSKYQGIIIIVVVIIHYQKQGGEP